MLWSAFLLGLAGSLHCVGMCGPITLLISSGNHQSRNRAILLYHLGKLMTYIIIGALFGLIVATVYDFNIQSILTIVSGVILLMFAFVPGFLSLLEKKGFTFFNSFFRFKNRILKSINKNRVEYSFFIGFFNGFIPCAMVYSAAIVALSQKTFGNSIVFMILFGLGTIPLMTIFYFMAGKIKARFSKHASTVRLISFLIVGLFLVGRGVYFYGNEVPQEKEGSKFEICLPF